MNSKPAVSTERDNTLSDLTRHANACIWKEEGQRDKYNVYIGSAADRGLDAAIFYVRRKRQEDSLENKQPACQERKDTAISVRVNARASWFVPTFQRTRVVRVSKQHGVSVATCSCHCFARMGYCCRHIYAVLTRKPLYTDASIRYWNIYEFRYKGSDKELTQKLKAIRDDTRLTGIKVELSDLVDQPIGDKPWHWFKEALNRFVGVCPGSG